MERMNKSGVKVRSDWYNDAYMTSIRLHIVRNECNLWVLSNSNSERVCMSVKDMDNLLHIWNNARIGRWNGRASLRVPSGQIVLNGNIFPFRRMDMSIPKDSKKLDLWVTLFTDRSISLMFKEEDMRWLMMAWYSLRRDC